MSARGGAVVSAQGGAVGLGAGRSGRARRGAERSWRSGSARGGAVVAVVAGRGGAAPGGAVVVPSAAGTAAAGHCGHRHCRPLMLVSIRSATSVRGTGPGPSIGDSTTHGRSAIDAGQHHRGRPRNRAAARDHHPRSQTTDKTTDKTAALPYVQQTAAWPSNRPPPGSRHRRDPVLGSAVRTAVRPVGMRGFDRAWLPGNASRGAVGPR